jgi:sporulation protein YlmC with PRC-barrel domain
VAETSQFTIGAEVRCRDGVAGEVTRVVVDPVARELTHLVVRPKHGRSLDRLVPLDLVEHQNAEVGLGCTVEEFEKLDPAEEIRFLPAGGGTFGAFSVGQTLYLPRFALLPDRRTSATITSETVPVGEVDVRRGDRVHATDGEIGQIEGLVINPSDHHVTHVLLQEGHLWGSKQVAIPISLVTKLDAGVDVSLTKQQVHQLPPVDLDKVDLDKTA